MRFDRARNASSGSEHDWGVVAASAGGVEVLRTQLVRPLIDRGHTVAVTLTPTAGEWLRATGELDKLQDLTGLPARDQPRLPSEPRPHPPIDVFAAAPLSVNSVAKLALGIADNQALTMLCENIAHVRVHAAPSPPRWSSFPESTPRTLDSRRGPITSAGSAQSASNSSTATQFGRWLSHEQPAPANYPGQQSSTLFCCTADSGSCQSRAGASAGRARVLAPLRAAPPTSRRWPRVRR